MVFRHAIVCWNGCKLYGRHCLEEMKRTSQWSRIAESPPTTDLRGGNTSEDSFTRLMANLVAAYVVDFQSDSLSSAAFESAVLPEDFGRLLWSLPGTGGVLLEIVSGSVLRERVFR
jgi:hypothetical protein